MTHWRRKRKKTFSGDVMRSIEVEYEQHVMAG
jgi:hypothetical protein